MGTVGNGGEILYGFIGYYHNVTKTTLFDELCKGKEVLQGDSLGEIDFMANPGGNSVWTGDMIAKCHRIYRGVRMTIPQIVSEGEIVPLFTTVPFMLVGSTIYPLQSVIDNISGAIRNHETVVLYAHRIGGTAVDLDAQRVTNVAVWLYDKAIPVVTYSQAFPVSACPNKPNYIRAKKAHVKGKERSIRPEKHRQLQRLPWRQRARWI